MIAKLKAAEKNKETRALPQGKPILANSQPEENSLTPPPPGCSC